MPGRSELRRLLRRQAGQGQLLVRRRVHSLRRLLCGLREALQTTGRMRRRPLFSRPRRELQHLRQGLRRLPSKVRRRDLHTQERRDLQHLRQGLRRVSSKLWRWNLFSGGRRDVQQVPEGLWSL